MRRYTKAQERLDAENLKRREIRDAIVKGMERGDHFEKPFDKAICIQIWIESAGFAIVKKAKRSEKW